MRSRQEVETRLIESFNRWRTRTSSVRYFTRQVSESSPHVNDSESGICSLRHGRVGVRPNMSMDATLIAVLADAVNAELNDIRLGKIIRTVHSAVSSPSCQRYLCVLMSLSAAAAAA